MEAEVHCASAPPTHVAGAHERCQRGGLRAPRWRANVAARRGRHRPPLPRARKGGYVAPTQESKKINPYGHQLHMPHRARWRGTPGMGGQPN
eukprot:CAMPEP_0170296428 /NCGR_PEP_ID=MMETSP0116_2-20130129/48360_1 /TAXON_ID=400756 /ORGANISM="Durinskia baltica, Strain CSIRO CS-38" /LENGTH=91 /DNA_ID=CAMNT_0010548023 /DNA_START=78 /DNA_END=353 /DNA_ORIENTATION=+